MKGWKIRTMAIATAVAAFAAPAAAYAGPEGVISEYCNQEQGGGGGLGGPVGDLGGPVGGRNQIGADLCAHGPAGCVSVGLYVRVEPNVAAPSGATIQLSRSATNAAGWNGSGYAHGDAAAANTSIPPTLGAGVLESSCDSYGYTQEWGSWNSAYGRATAERLTIDLNAYSIPVSLNVETLKEEGSSVNGSGTNGATVTTISGSVLGNPISIPVTAAPNTVVPLGLATLYLNEQTVGFGPCPVYHGDALRLVVNDPTTGAPLATVIVSSVSTSTCP